MHKDTHNLTDTKQSNRVTYTAKWINQQGKLKKKALCMIHHTGVAIPLLEHFKKPSQTVQQFAGNTFEIVPPWCAFCPDTESQPSVWAGGGSAKALGHPATKSQKDKNHSLLRAGTEWISANARNNNLTFAQWCKIILWNRYPQLNAAVLNQNTFYLPDAVHIVVSEKGALSKLIWLNGEVGNYHGVEGCLQLSQNLLWKACEKG